MPRGYVDGHSEGDFAASWLSGYLPRRSLVNAPLDISVSNPAAAANLLALTVAITPRQDIIDGNPTLYVAVVEQQVNGLTNVMRKMLPAASGTSLALPLLKGTTSTITLDPWEVKNINFIAQLSIVAFVQDKVTKDILQSTVKVTLDNPPTKITGLEANPSELVSIFPNPANKEFKVQLPAAAKQQVTLKLWDQVGKVVHESFIPEGALNKTVGTGDLPAGVYVLHVDVGNGSTVRKKIVVVHE